MRQLEINSRWKHKTSEDVYVVVEQYSHRVVLKHEPSGRIFKVTVGHLNPECPEHGYNSVWYNSPEQVKKRGERSQRLRELYDARRKAQEAK